LELNFVRIFFVFKLFAAARNQAAGVPALASIGRDQDSPIPGLTSGLLKGN
jgi:hypothetical protein